MSPDLCSLLMALQVLQALTAAATPSVQTCRTGGEREVVVDGWPLLAALRIPDQAQFTMNLGLSHDHEAHTNLTLTQSLLNNVGVLQVTLNSLMMVSTLKTAAHLPDSSWATLSIIAHQKALEMKIESETRSVKYSTSTWVSTLHQLHINKVSCFGRNCDSYIDLKCRYNNSLNNHTKPYKPISNTSTSDRRVYYWVFYVVVSLLVVACLLFLVWRNEQKKFRTRWWTHSQTVRSMTSFSEPERNSCQADRTSEMVEWRAGTSVVGQSNPAYDMNGDPD